MLASKPDCEKRQMSAAEIPFAGRKMGIALPARLQVFVAVTYNPRAATSRSRLLREVSTPALVGSTTTMSLPPFEGTLLESGILACVVEGATTTRETALEFVPSAF